MPAPAAPATAKVHPIIIVHAVTAAGLHDHYPPDAERVWSPWEMLKNDYERIQLYPYDPAENRPASLPRYEAAEPSLVRPSELFGIVYKDLIAELKHNLSYPPTPVQPVFPFVYDWRQDNRLSAARLRDFVEEAIDRTRLLRHDAAKVGGPLCDSCDLIAHSMGGLVVAAAIASDPTWSASHIRRVVTLGTPFRGANAAIQKLATGGGTLFGRDAKERERTMARVTPALYQLLPSFAGAVVNSDSSPMDIFDPATFQPSIPDTIAEFVATSHADHAVAKKPTECRRIAADLLAQLLASARSFRTLTDSVSPAMLRPDGAWLAIVGAGEKTHVKTGITRDPYNKPWFDFQRPDAFSPAQYDPASLHTGDETVPLPSATPPWTDSWKNSVVVLRRDFEFLGEMGDRILCDQLGLHSTLPLLDLAQRWIVNFLRPNWASDPKLGQHGKLWGRTLPAFPKSLDKAAVWSNTLIPGLKLSNDP